MENEIVHLAAQLSTEDLLVLLRRLLHVRLAKSFRAGYLRKISRFPDFLAIFQRIKLLPLCLKFAELAAIRFLAKNPSPLLEEQRLQPKAAKYIAFAFAFAAVF